MDGRGLRGLLLRVFFLGVYGAQVRRAAGVGVDLLLEVLDRLVQEVLHRRQGGHDGRTSEAVRDEREVRQVALYVRLEDVLRPRVAERGPVLVQQVHELLHRAFCGQQHFFSAVEVGWFDVISTQVLRHLSGRELGLADVTEVPG